MRYLGEILSEHKWIILIVIFIVVIGIFAGARESVFNDYEKNYPIKSWENISENMLILFTHNLSIALMALVGFVLAFYSALGLGMTLGITIWIMPKYPVYTVGILLNHGILEIYSIFLAIFCGFLLLTRIGEAIVGFFGTFSPHYVDWQQVLEDYTSLFLFSIIGLFVAAWMEALFGYAMQYASSLTWPVIIVDSLISLFLIGFSSFPIFRALVTRKAKLTLSATVEQEERLAGGEKLPDDVWCVCPKCGAYISADIEYCVCGAKLPKRQKKKNSSRVRVRSREHGRSANI